MINNNGILLNLLPPWQFETSNCEKSLEQSRKLDPSFS